MSLPVKLTIGTLTLGSIGGATYAGIVYSQKGTPINELIKKEYKYILLDTSSGTANTDNTYWKTYSTKYNTDNTDKTAGNDIFKLSGWVKGGQTDLTEALKTKCIEISKLTVYDNKDENYINATKYCGRSVTLKDEAIKNGLDVIDTEGNTLDATWTKKNEKKAKLTSYLTKLSIAESDINATKIKDGCKTAQTKDKTLSDYSEYLEAYTKVCTKQTEDTTP